MNGIRGHTEDIEKDKVDGEATGRFAAVVEDGLWIEGGGPAQHVGPADDCR